MIVKHPADGADVEAVVRVVHNARVGRQPRLPGQLCQPAPVLQRYDVRHPVVFLRGTTQK